MPVRTDSQSFQADVLADVLQPANNQSVSSLKNIAPQKRTAPQKTNKSMLPAPPKDSRQRFKRYVQTLQDNICTGLERLDGEARFQEDIWQRENGGGGRTRVIREGGVFEQGGVNFSEVWGKGLPPAIISQYPEATGHDFYVTGTSMVLHPRNPYVPTVHLNYRYFEAGPVWWFGGGVDLTPYYPVVEDVVHFHRTIKQACDQHHPDFYSVFKPWCDEYFYLKHRQETRGVGGIFFDYLNSQSSLYNGPHPEGAAAQKNQASQTSQEVNQQGTPASHAESYSWEALFSFVQSCGNSFLPAYLPIAERHKEQPYGQRERNFQLYRRGRYVEFNLVYDRGTVFGLQTQGRTESILMSLPPLARWEYSYTPEPGTPEANLYDTFLRPQDWANWKTTKTKATKTTTV